LIKSFIIYEIIVVTYVSRVGKEEAEILHETKIRRLCTKLNSGTFTKGALTHIMNTYVLNVITAKFNR